MLLELACPHGFTQAFSLAQGLSRMPDRMGNLVLSTLLQGMEEPSQDPGLLGHAQALN